MKRLIGSLLLTSLLLLTSCEKDEREESNEVTASLEESTEIDLNRGVGVMSPEKYTVKVITAIEFEGYTGPLRNRNFTVTPNCPSEVYANEYFHDRNMGLAGTYISDEEGSFEFKLLPNSYCISSRFTFDSGVNESPPICIGEKAYHLETYVYAGSDNTVELGNESLKLVGNCSVYP